jgi:hypothetical protein
VVTSTSPSPKRSSELHVGDIGIGRGGTASGRRRAPATTNAEVNDRLRSAVRLSRALSVPGGIAVDGGSFDDLLSS